MTRKHPFLWVALDGLGRHDSHITSDLLLTMNQVSGEWGWKINLDSLLDHGAAEAVLHLPDRDAKRPRPRFADIKGHNGHRTLERLLEPLAEAAFSHVNFHVADSDDLRPVARKARSLEIVTLGLTQLSHGEVSVGRVQELVHDAERYGLDEVIVPAKVAPDISTDLRILGTGFRPEGPDENQPHALHPRQARGRVNSVAIGSPIMKAEDPVAGLQQHLDWLCLG